MAHLRWYVCWPNSSEFQCKRFDLLTDLMGWSLEEVYTPGRMFRDLSQLRQSHANWCSWSKGNECCTFSRIPRMVFCVSRLEIAWRSVCGANAACSRADRGTADTLVPSLAIINSQSKTRSRSHLLLMIGFLVETDRWRRPQALWQDCGSSHFGTKMPHPVLPEPNCFHKSFSPLVPLNFKAIQQPSSTHLSSPCRSSISDRASFLLV
ncbi:hypothetical protein QBC44DRAFT_59516 [Cladorrhinum sp. PSN332]|nr:hypothetical protein QBC44DRAFT_59516 [Cladorrhinum sp. PSN332]